MTKKSESNSKAKNGNAKGTTSRMLAAKRSAQPVEAEPLAVSAAPVEAGTPAQSERIRLGQELEKFLAKSIDKIEDEDFIKREDLPIEVWERIEPAGDLSAPARAWHTSSLPERTFIHYCSLGPDDPFAAAVLAMEKYDDAEASALHRAPGEDTPEELAELAVVELRDTLRCNHHRLQRAEASQAAGLSLTAALEVVLERRSGNADALVEWKWIEKDRARAGRFY